MFEGFAADNYIFLNMTELMEWCEKVLDDFKEDNYEFDDFMKIKSVYDVKDRLLEKILESESNDEDVLESYLNDFSDEELTILYYKNNMIEFIRDHQIIQDIILSVYENVENLKYGDESSDDWFCNVPKKYTSEFSGKTCKDWNKFVNKSYFMDPNDPPESIISDLYELKTYFMKYVYCRYLSFDRVYRLRNFKRGVVTVIDTDSNILSLDTVVNFIFNEVVKGNTFGRDPEKNTFIVINMLAYTLTAAVQDILLTYGKHSNIPEEFRPIYSMKNEFYFSRLVIGSAKKRYISKIILREGNLMNPPKSDIKGLNYRSIIKQFIMKNMVNCWEISLRQSAAKTNLY